MSYWRSFWWTNPGLIALRLEAIKRNSSPKLCQIQLVGLFLGPVKKSQENDQTVRCKKSIFRIELKSMWRPPQMSDVSQQKGEKPPAKMSHCWWFRNLANQWRLVVYPIIDNVLYIPGGCLGSLPETFRNLVFFRWGGRFSTWATYGVAGRWSQVHRWWEMSWVALAHGKKWKMGPLNERKLILEVHPYSTEPWLWEEGLN